MAINRTGVLGLSSENQEKNIVIFDGVCNFCSDAVAFIYTHDPKGQYYFAPLQSEKGRQLLLDNGLDPLSIETFLLVKNNKAYTKSDAGLEIIRDLSGLWKLLFVFKLIPKPIRDFMYTSFAKNRYKLFGQKQSCMMPGPNLRKRFVDLV